MRTAAALGAVFAAAAVVVLAPLLLGGSHAGTIASALATADAGDYVVAIGGDESSDLLLAFAAADPGSIREIARIDRLPGYVTRGSTSPIGRRAALIVADGGTQSHPTASLLLADLDSGSLIRIANRVDVLQVPLFSPDGTAIFFTRTLGGESPAADVDIVSFDITSGIERKLMTVQRVLGAYPVGFDGVGTLLTVVIDGAGSSLRREGVPSVVLSTSITRDWRVSADGRHLAFIETTTAGGVRYHARQVDLHATGSAYLSAQEASNGQQLGVAWRPGAAGPTVGQEPSPSVTGALSASSTTAGFDVPMGYSPGGDLLVVEAWTGNSFAAPGVVEMQLIRGERRTSLTGATRFLGWVTR